MHLLSSLNSTSSSHSHFLSLLSIPHLYVLCMLCSSFVLILHPQVHLEPSNCPKSHDKFVVAVRNENVGLLFPSAITPLILLTNELGQPPRASWTKKPNSGSFRIRLVNAPACRKHFDSRNKHSASHGYAGYKPLPDRLLFFVLLTKRHFTVYFILFPDIWTNLSPAYFPFPLVPLVPSPPSLYTPAPEGLSSLTISH